MRRLLGEAMGGNSRIAVVSGAAGHGKTELLAALAEEARRAGAVHLSATASRMERYVPFGVLAQLFRGVELPPAAAGHVAHLLDRALSADAATVQDSVAIPPRLFHQMGTALHDLVKYVERPLLISVDDVEYADTPSLLCLSSLTRRLRATPLLLVLNELPSPRRSSTLLRAELPPEPVCHRVRLPPLSLGGVRELLAARLGPSAAQALDTECLAATGGNPFLVRGLVEDTIAAATEWPAAPVLSAGTLFEQAVLGCLYRCATSVRTIARIMAVLHDPRYVPLLVQLPGTHPQSLNLALSTLEETGLLADGAWRHPDARTAVLHDMTPEARAELHTRIGTLLFKNGAPVTAVAHHLVAASQIDNDCAAAVLLEAAQEGLSTGDTTLATDCLSVAYRYDRSKEHFTATTAMLFRTEWRSDPRTAARRLPSLLEAARCGLLTGRHVSAPVDALLWFGRPNTALEILEQMERHARLRQDAEASATLRRCRTTLALMYPATAEEGDTAAAGESYVPLAATRGQTLVELERVLRDGPGPLSALCAEQALVSHQLDDDTLIPLVLAVSTLIVNGSYDAAEQWIDSLAAAARSRSAPVWRALFESLRAKLALHRGEPAEAARLAERALAETPAASWGVHIGLPLTVTLEAYTVLGSPERALAQLQVVPPEGIFQTLLGVCYLRARGNALLASGQSQAALDDFAAVGELATRWQMDVPALLPWRTDAARAHLARGEITRARELATEQSVLVGPGHHEARSLTLRTLAATAPPQERMNLLGQALEAAQKCGNPLELAYTFNALSRCHLDTGQYSKGRMALRRARQLAEQSGVPLPARTPPEAARRPQELAASGTGGETLVGVLSDAEMRVVALAVRGHSNRQIAAKLFVTVSTVEQHLTRVYRKLGIKRRSDLALAVNGEGGPGITTRRAS